MWLLILEKVVYEKPDWVQGQVTYQEGTIKTIAPF